MFIVFDFLDGIASVSNYWQWCLGWFWI